jgi:phosphate starvation-inducible PhoH-like protein
MKHKNKSSKKLTTKYIEDEINIYEENKLNKIIYENYKYLSLKEKELFDNKFSKPKNSSQQKYFKELNKQSKKIVISTGSAGTGKTLFAVEYAIKQFLLGNYDKLIFTRPLVCVDEDIGYLPGDVNQKLEPWVKPIFDIIYNFISPVNVQNYIDEKIFEIAPLGFMRGRTFKNSCIIADEMQNSTIAQMKMLLTRIGENSKIIITGDLAQSDNKIDDTNGLDDFLDKLSKTRSDSISSIEFNNDDIQREQVIKEILEIYSRDEIPVNYKNLES